MKTYRKYLDEARRRKRDPREIDGEEYEWGITSDGWNTDDLEDTGLMEWLDAVRELTYELKNARRNSYAEFGDTIKDLGSYLRELSRNLNNIARDIVRRQ